MGICWVWSWVWWIVPCWQLFLSQTSSSTEQLIEHIAPQRSTNHSTLLFTSHCTTLHCFSHQTPLHCTALNNNAQRFRMLQFYTAAQQRTQVNYRNWSTFFVTLPLQTVVWLAKQAMMESVVSETNVSRQQWHNTNCHGTTITTPQALQLF